MADRTTELQDALKLADRLLDEPSADPDDDLRMLSRQLLRQHELAEKYKWQVRDTCVRAERAEALLSKAGA